MERKAFCLSSKVNYIMNLRSALAKEEADLADVGKEALIYLDEKVGGVSPIPYGQLSGRLDDKGRNLVYDFGRGTIQVLPVSFLYNPDGFITKYLADRAVLNEEVDCSPEADHNYVVTNYP